MPFLDHPYAWDSQMAREAREHDALLVLHEEDELAQERAQNARQPWELWVDPEGFPA